MPQRRANGVHELRAVGLAPVILAPCHLARVRPKKRGIAHPAPQESGEGAKGAHGGALAEVCFRRASSLCKMLSLAARVFRQGSDMRRVTFDRGRDQNGTSLAVPPSSGSPTTSVRSLSTPLRAPC
jgi:hypothetical protein